MKLRDRWGSRIIDSARIAFSELWNERPKSYPFSWREQLLAYPNWAT